jgi:hypothetical protein
MAARVLLARGLMLSTIAAPAVAQEAAWSRTAADQPLSDTRYVSHENAGFRSVGQGMKAGLDKKLYLWGGPYVMRISPDGSGKAGTDTTDTGDPALTAITGG